jgi:hypothetical protein
MTWTDERMMAALGNLDAPTTDEAFWARVHSDLLTCHPDLESTTSEVLLKEHPLSHVERFRRSPGRGRGYLTVAAAAAVLVAGLYWIGRAPDRTPASTPVPSNVVLTDPLSLSLDDQPRTATPQSSESDFVVLDLAKLPSGWTGTETSAGVMWPPENAYRTVYSLVGPKGESYSVNIIVGLSLKPDSGIQIDINGHEGLQNASNVWWEQERGVGVTVSRAPVAGDDGDGIVEAARVLAFATVEELPIVRIDPAAEPSRTGAQFAGTLNGAKYAAYPSTGPLRGILVSVGDGGGAGVDNDRLSQPTDDPETSGGVNILGVPGYGGIAFGYTVPGVAALRANLADGSTVQAPVLRNPSETYFALPIPLGVEVTTLDFLDDAGAPMRSAIMPTLPAYFGNCCASAPWSTDVGPDSPSSTTTS